MSFLGTAKLNAPFFPFSGVWVAGHTIFLWVHLVPSVFNISEQEVDVSFFLSYQKNATSSIHALALLCVCKVACAHFHGLRMLCVISVFSRGKKVMMVLFY